MKICKVCKLKKEFNCFNLCKKTKSGYFATCKDCRKIKIAKYKELNFDKVKEIGLKSRRKNSLKIKEYRDKNKDRHKVLARNYYVKNREKMINNSREWANSEKNKIKKRINSNNYRRKNEEKCKYYCAARRARKKNATPKWLNLEQLRMIKLIYAICPKGFEVDHIVPLKGKNVCGLHVPWNLQYLTKEENLKKGNKVEV